MIRAPSGICSPLQPVGIAAAVPALVVVQHPLRDRLDAEALEHPVADLRMPLEHEPLRLVERARLAQDLLGDRELAQVVQAAREARQLDLRLVDAEPCVRSAPRARRRARSGCRCRRRARRRPSPGSPQRGSARRGQALPRAAAAARARECSRPGRCGRGSCRLPSPSRAHCQQGGSARPGRRPARGTRRRRRSP